MPNLQYLGFVCVNEIVYQMHRAGLGPALDNTVIYGYGKLPVRLNPYYMAEFLQRYKFDTLEQLFIILNVSVLYLVCVNQTNTSKNYRVIAG